MLLETERNFDLGSFDAAQDSVDEYLRSVGDALPIYRETGLVPPLFLAASSLGSLLRELALPPGAINVCSGWILKLISGIRWGKELVEIAGGAPIFPELRDAKLGRDRIALSRRPRAPENRRST